MARYSKKQPVSEQSKEEAMSIAKGIQKPGQNKEQTKLVAQGIQKGIELYKKQHKAKSRDLDKQLKKAKEQSAITEKEEVIEDVTKNSQVLPWSLLLISWLAFALFELYLK